MIIHVSICFIIPGMKDEMENMLDDTMNEQKSQEGSNYKSSSPCPSLSLSYLLSYFARCVCA